MTKRSYRQNCALARAGDLIGERWSLLLIRDLLLGPRRFGELERSLKGIGSNLLAARLRALEAAGILERRPERGSGHVYVLTQRGQALEPALLALVRWGLVHAGEREPGFHHLDEWDLVALKALFHPEYARDLSLTVQFKTDDFAGWMAIDKQRVNMALGEQEQPDITVKATVRELFTGSKDPQELCASGSSRDLIRFMSAFVLRV